MQYLFELGRIPELSRAEIEHVFLAQKIPTTVNVFEKNILILETPKIDIEKIMEQLGGTIKVAEFISEQTSVEAIGDYLNTTQAEGKIQFSLTGNNARNLALEVKKYLKELGRSVRYIEAKNTATILHNNLVEKQGDLTLTKQGLFITRGIQPIEEWGERDFGRPGRDSRSGMLPPKLARILINLTGASTDGTILDPFCGSGTILTEAMSLGFAHIIGSDTSEKALDDTRKNIEWMKSQIADIKPSTPKLILSGAGELHGKIAPSSIDAIAAEPYMGKPLRGTEDKRTLEKQASELKEMYVNAFKAFAKILTPGGVAVFIIPRFLCDKTWIRIHCTERIQDLGFSLERLTETEPSILYSRPGQFVGREIWKFKKI